MIEAKIIKDSISHMGYRLISIQTRTPKFLDAEIEKHRMISSNSSSSRAIPTNKMLAANIYIPEDIRLDESGMQGYETISDEEYKKWEFEARDLFADIMYEVINWQDKYNIHKQHLNRYLEPFKMQYKIMTANKEQWDYFLSLRDAKDADPAIQDLARKIREAIADSNTQLLESGEWHLPYIESRDSRNRRISAARCARTSYKTHEGREPTKEEDLKLATMLIDSRHLTPFEHQATPYNPFGNKGPHMYRKDGHMYSGNFMEWEQYRQEL